MSVTASARSTSGSSSPQRVPEALRHGIGNTTELTELPARPRLDGTGNRARDGGAGGFDMQVVKKAMQKLHGVARLVSRRVIRWVRWHHQHFQAADHCQDAGDVCFRVHSIQQGLCDRRLAGTALRR